MALADLSASGSGSPFSGNSIAPNFTTSQTNAQKINQTGGYSRFDAGVYIAGTGSSINKDGGGSIPWKPLGVLAVLVAAVAWWRSRKKKE